MGGREGGEGGRGEEGREAMGKGEGRGDKECSCFTIPSGARAHTSVNLLKGATGTGCMTGT